MSENKTRVLHFSPHNEDDGIAKYQEQYLAGMADDTTVQNQFFDITPIQLRAMSSQQHEAAYDELREELDSYDIFHLQHEFGLYVEDDFQRLVATAKDAGKKVVVTVHLSPDFAIKPVKLGGLGPHSMVSFLRQQRHRNRMYDRHITPFLQADLLIVHNDITAQALIGAGANPDKIQKLPHPVHQFPTPPKSDFVAKRLHKQSGDVIYCTVGMLHKYKGIFDAVRALKFLPSNYKLAIIGGLHPVETDIVSETVGIYNKITDLIDALGLHDRVFITGFVKDDDQMNSYIRECDVCVYPYDGVYYANTSSGAVNLGFSNGRPVVAYPTKGFRELAAETDGALVLTDTFAYYELARKLADIDLAKQAKLSNAYATKMAWPVMAKELIKAYHQVAGK
jgi:glycosyltransferase involved in cell wall biosynthesis